MTMTAFKKSMMPILARHEGDWYGEYVHVDDDGQEVDRHYSHLISTYPQDGSCDYHQVNRYAWENGDFEEHLFPGAYDAENNRIIFDTERIWGWAREVDERHVQLQFTYKNGDDNYVYEFIHLSDDGQNRTRTWHWYNQDGVVYKRTLIRESRKKTRAHEDLNL